jgi:hypothetical protein
MWYITLLLIVELFISLENIFTQISLPTLTDQGVLGHIGTTTTRRSSSASRSLTSLLVMSKHIQLIFLVWDWLKAKTERDRQRQHLGTLTGTSHWCRRWAASKLLRSSLRIVTAQRNLNRYQRRRDHNHPSWVVHFRKIPFMANHSQSHWKRSRWSVRYC